MPDEKSIHLRDEDLEIKTTKGSGPGGQHRNKVESEVVMIHKPTGIQVRCGSRSQYQNKQLARQIIAAKLAVREQETSAQTRNQARRDQIGDGARGQKVRTVRVQDNMVKCERTGRQITYQQYLKGNLP